MPRISITLGCVLLLAAAILCAGCKPKEPKAPAAPPVASTPAPEPGTPPEPGEPATETPPAAEKPVSVASDVVFTCGDISLGMPLADIRAKYANNKVVKEQWPVPDDTGSFYIIPGYEGSAGAPSPNGPPETMQFFFKGAKLVGYFHAKGQPKADDFANWVKREGAQLPPPGQVLPDFAKDIDICSVFAQLDPKAQNAIWFNESAQTLLGAHYQPDGMLGEVLVDAKPFKEMMGKVRQTPPIKAPGQAPPPPETK